jgi:hypothetical protein
MIRGSCRRVPELLRLLHVLALAIVAVVCAGIASPAPGIACQAARSEVAARDSASAVRALAPQPSRPWRYLDAVEADLDDDDIDDDRDRQSDVADDPATTFRGVGLPSKLDRALRGDAPIDTSRFAIGSCRPRGPPV